MTKIKICGLKRLQDIEYVNELLPDFIGFVFAGTKRKITDEKAKELASVAPAQTFIVDPKTFSMKRKNSTLPPLTNR